MQQLDRYKNELLIVQWHIPSKYTKEMCTTSKVVTHVDIRIKCMHQLVCTKQVLLGIQFYNESKIIDTLCHILDGHYAPVKKHKKLLQKLNNLKLIILESFQILLLENN